MNPLAATAMIFEPATQSIGYSPLHLGVHVDTDPTLIEHLLCAGASIYVTNYEVNLRLVTIAIQNNGHSSQCRHLCD